MRNAMHHRSYFAYDAPRCLSNSNVALSDGVTVINASVPITAQTTTAPRIQQHTNRVYVIFKFARTGCVLYMCQALGLMCTALANIDRACNASAAGFAYENTYSLRTCSEANVIHKIAFGRGLCVRSSCVCERALADL